MNINTILSEIQEAKGDKKKSIMTLYHNNVLFKTLLEYTYNNYKQYFVIKVPEVKERYLTRISDDDVWNPFFNLLDRCDKHELSGNLALNSFLSLFSSISRENEFWMRKVLERHLNIGISIPTINKIYPGLVKEFKVQLAEEFEEKRIKNKERVAVEPKLDGFRCLAILKDKKCVLYSRNGKDISRNFQDTICRDLEKMLDREKIIDCVLDGELMGKSFKHTTEQVHKKTNSSVREIFFNVFDFISMKDWIEQSINLTCQEAREKIEDLCFEQNCIFVKTVQREIIEPKNIKNFHKVFTEKGYEGVMIKILDEKYKFGRGFNVMKYKEFIDLDLPCIFFEEGEGRNSGRLGAIIVNHNGTNVNVGSGFSDEQRAEIWENRSRYRGVIAEIRAQEITEDNSLRFPTFRGWRFDKMDKYKSM